MAARRFPFQWILALALVLGFPAVGEPVNVVLGQTDCFVLRVPDGDISTRERAAHLRAVFERRLGRTPGRFTLRADGARRLIYLDGEFLVAVTPADALATHHESAATLAPVWRDRLRAAWLENQPGRRQTAAVGTREDAAAAAGGLREGMLLLTGIILFALLVMMAALQRQSRQVATLLQESAQWRRDVGEALQQPRALAALPPGEGSALTPAMQSEVARLAREHSEAAVKEAAQQICDSVERVLAGLLEEMARGMSRPPSPAGGSPGVSLTGPLSAREPALAGGPRPTSAGPSNGGNEGAARPAADRRPPTAGPATRETAPNTPAGDTQREQNDAPDTSPVTAVGGRPSTVSDPAPRRGPATLEIDAFGKTYAFPMAPDRAREVLAAWQTGQPVPESWLHESGITTARLQPLLDRFVLRRQLGGDGSLAYLLDTRGGAVRISLRNLG